MEFVFFLEINFYFEFFKQLFNRRLKVLQDFPFEEWEERVKISYKEILGINSPSCKIQYL